MYIRDSCIHVLQGSMYTYIYMSNECLLADKPIPESDVVVMGRSSISTEKEWRYNTMSLQNLAHGIFSRVGISEIH